MTESDVVVPKVGRPTDYNKEFHTTDIIRLGKEGCGVEEIASEWDVVKQTVYNWTEKHPEFLDAFNKAREHSVAWWMSYGRKNMENKDTNARMYEIQVMNRLGWSKKQDTDVTSKGERVSLNVTFVKPE